MSFVIPVVAGSDWHSGWTTIPQNIIVQIKEYRVSVTYGAFEIFGVLLIEGTLVVEP